MYGLIQCLYSENKQKAFEALYHNSDVKDQMLLRSTIAEALKDCPRLLESHGSDWIFCTLASFHKNEEDTARVYQAIMRHLDNFSFGLLTDKIKWKEMNEIADCCLVGLSFFRKYLETKHQRKAAPSPEYYEKVGSVAFSRVGYEHIGEDFNGWIHFIEKEMTN